MRDHGTPGLRQEPQVPLGVEQVLQVGVERAGEVGERHEVVGRDRPAVHELLDGAPRPGRTVHQHRRRRRGGAEQGERRRQARRAAHRRHRPARVEGAAALGPQQVTHDREVGDVGRRRHQQLVRTADERAGEVGTERGEQRHRRLRARAPQLRADRGAAVAHVLQHTAPGEPSCVDEVGRVRRVHDLVARLELLLQVAQQVALGIRVKVHARLVEEHDPAVLLRELREGGEEGEEPEEAARALGDVEAHAPTLVAHPDVQPGLRRRQAHRLQVELDRQVAVLAPVGEQLVGQASRGGRERRLVRLVLVGAERRVGDAREPQQGQCRALRRVQVCRVELLQATDRDAARQHVVVVEVLEARQHGREVGERPLRDLEGCAVLVERPVQRVVAVAAAREQRCRRQPLAAALQTLAVGVVELDLERHGPDVVDPVAVGPEVAARVVAARRERRRVAARQRVGAVEGLQHGGLARLVLADERGEALVERQSARVLHRHDLADPCSDQSHASNLPGWCRRDTGYWSGGREGGVCARSTRSP